MQQLDLSEWEHRNEVRLKEPKKLKRLKYYVTLTSAYTKCPYCGAENPNTPDGWANREIDIPSNYCRGCYTRYDEDNLEEIPSLNIKALRWYKEKHNISTYGSTTEEMIKQSTKEYKEYLNECKRTNQKS